ncbi:histidine-type phosphatase [Streptomyces brasiliscabiei]|uniref:Multiple inositol polyphosphate phosphatase 1 n=1 Tax=Streptomyces brasiliscabiei TaxID=2736302 RepID=A0ABU8GIQ6_9ACTN
MRRTTPAVALGLSALLAAAPLSARAASSGHTSATTLSYGTKATYAPRQNARTYQSAPKGFVPVFTENVSRHGSRSATDSSDGDLVLALWDKAESEGQLTSRGREFGPRVRALEAAMAKVGYGNLSGRGKREMRDTATRLEKRLPELFRRIARTPGSAGKIDVVSSGQGRAVDSGTAFAGALGDAAPAVKPLIGPARVDKNLLYFHKSSGGAAYQDWLANDQRLADTLKDIKDQPATARAARNVLKKIFKPAFVQRIEAGEFASTGSAVDAAEAVYNLYAIAPAMSEESPGGRGWGMDRYIARRDAAWFGYLGDAEDFYEKGPGFADSDITYRMANVLLDDFFKQVEAKRDGTSRLGAELRFTHAEEIIPLAALMGLPGSTKGVTAGRPYTYADNAWRGADVAPLGANIQWDVFKKGSTYAVRMLYNEKETAFKTGCRPMSKHSSFYELNELERCFGRKPQS